MPPAITVENLGKCYRVHPSEARPAYVTLRDTLADSLRQFRWRRNSQFKSNFWALQDITFEVQPGEVLGIIGPNGAGKSTLLKILSRITKPTRGHGRIEG